jgi:hypothetical protein
MDLHTFGFRPDLSRRSLESRMSEKDQWRTPAESVAIDAASNTSTVNGGPLAEYIAESFHFFYVAHNASEPMAEHLLAGLCVGKDCEPLILDTLRAIYNAPTGWGGNDTLGAAIMVRA